MRKPGIVLRLSASEKSARSRISCPEMTSTVFETCSAVCSSPAAMVTLSVMPGPSWTSVSMRPSPATVIRSERRDDRAVPLTMAEAVIKYLPRETCSNIYLPFSSVLVCRLAAPVTPFSVTAAPETAAPSLVTKPDTEPPSPCPNSAPAKQSASITANNTFISTPFLPTRRTVLNPTRR